MLDPTCAAVELSRRGIHSSEFEPAGVEGGIVKTCGSAVTRLADHLLFRRVVRRVFLIEPVNGVSDVGWFIRSPKAVNTVSVVLVGRKLLGRGGGTGRP
jgi:hypothetical protein